MNEHGRIDFNQGEVQFETYSSVYQKWFSFYVYSPAYGEFVAMFSDITDRKLTEQELIRSRQRISDILASIQDGFFALDRDWKFIYINKRSANNGNFVPEELIGKNNWNEFSYLIGTELDVNYRKAMDERTPVRFELYSKREQKYYSISIYPTAEGISVYWVDITHQKNLKIELLNEREHLKAI